jgi:hypothetical protein
MTSELRSRFIQEISKTVSDGDEHGFLICKDNNGNLSPSLATNGSKYHINFEDIKSQCPFKIQGDFHTHASVEDVRNFIKDKIPEQGNVPENLLRDITVKLYKENGVSTTSPSHGDLLGVLVLKKKNKVSGTVCMGSDAEPHNVECWTTRDNIKDEHYEKANTEIKDVSLLRNIPHKWIKPLFHREIINLK